MPDIPDRVEAVQVIEMQVEKPVVASEYVNHSLVDDWRWKW